MCMNFIVLHILLLDSGYPPWPCCSCYPQRKIIDTLHGLVHPGTNASIRLVMERVAWNGLQKDVCEWTRCCVPCQTTKLHRQSKPRIGIVDAPDARFHCVPIDLVCPLSPLRVHRFLLTCVDRFRRWCEAISLADSHTETISVAFLQSWVARFGAPRSVKTDHGARFEPTLLFRQCKCLGYERIRTTAHHPATNGMVKRHGHAHLKARLKCWQHNTFPPCRLRLIGVCSPVRERFT